MEGDALGSYLCFIQVKPGGTPELRLLDCDSDERVASVLPAALSEWPALHHVEVTEGERIVLSVAGPELEALRSAGNGIVVLDPSEKVGGVIR